MSADVIVEHVCTVQMQTQAAWVRVRGYLLVGLPTGATTGVTTVSNRRDISMHMHMYVGMNDQHDAMQGG